MTVSTTDIVFMIVATLCLALLGWGVRTGALPWIVSGAEPSFGALTASFSSWERTAFGIYMVTATTLGLILPLVALFAWGRHADVRAALLPYALVLLLQIVIEGVFAHIFFPNLVVLIGFTYTLYRVWQLWGARRVFAATAQPNRYAKPLISTLLNASLVYWSVNALFLVTVMVPPMVRVV